ncbi:hypothetical protein PLESTF_001667500 [Pleodorina starrii]|nr:hypothetical protein PLESTF_001667500 [Pleodorina starrii]
MGPPLPCTGLKAPPTMGLKLPPPMKGECMCECAARRSRLQHNTASPKPADIIIVMHCTGRGRLAWTACQRSHIDAEGSPFKLQLAALGVSCY